jgi:hypothetical protein
MTFWWNTGLRRAGSDGGDADGASTGTCESENQSTVAAMETGRVMTA